MTIFTQADSSRYTVKCTAH